VNIGPAFWVIMAVGGAVLLGVALTYGLISRRGRRVEKSDPGKEEAAARPPRGKRGRGRPPLAGRGA
jgi:hypothetical protein